MKWQQQREEFKKLVIKGGIQQLEQIEKALPFGCTVPYSRLNRWLNDMLTVPSEFCSQRRWVNRFKLGADPEFIFVDKRPDSLPMRIDAVSLNLQQGLAFGMDNNGRLTEMRPHPSRSAVNVVASLLAELRWMVLYKPETLKYGWQAGAFLMGDGLGGHVHFGRKRPNRDSEVHALDTLEAELLTVKAYPYNEVMRRRQGDEHHNAPYGMPGDIRTQLHGYEYRTFPSWLDSPELAFLTLVLSKLAVHNPGLWQGYEPLADSNRHLQRIRNLLAAYKYDDDDARLALMMISRKFPVHLGGDFKGRWGIPMVLPTTELPEVKYIPSSIKPGADDVEEMFAYLRGKQTLGWRVPKPTWEPLVPPEGYTLCITKAQTRLTKGLGELLCDVVMPKSFDQSFVSSNGDLRNGVFFSIPKSIARQLPSDWRRLCGGRVTAHEGDDRYIYSAAKSRENKNFLECRKVLLETVLPFWRISEVKKDSFQQWQTQGSKHVVTQFAGKVLHGSLTALPFKDFR